MKKAYLYIKIALIIGVILSAPNLYAQAQVVKGRVTSAEDGSGLPGVNVLVKGTSTGTATDFDGSYSINAPDNATLVFSFLGFVSQEIVVGNQTSINVKLSSDVKALSEVVVVGYGTQKKADVTGAVVGLSSEDFNRGAISSPDQLIQGRAPGINITQSSGEPGAGASIRIRGGTSINASNEPLYVIDGVPIDNGANAPSSGLGDISAGTAKNPLSTMNPNDIEKIDVLKDASAAAIYGSRGANGVILITTKKGAGKATLNYDGFYGFSTISKKLDVLSADEYRAFAAKNNISSTLGTASTDWQDEITRVAPTQSHSLSLGGGSKATTYRASVNFFDQRGIIINSGNRRYSGRINVTHKMFDDRLNIGINLTASNTVDDNIANGTVGAIETAGVVLSAIKINPTQPVRNPDGSYFIPLTNRINDKNPVQLASAINDKTRTDRTLGNIFAEYELFSGLKARINLASDRNFANRKSYAPSTIPVYENNGGPGLGGRADIGNINRSTNLFEATLNYTKALSDVQNLSVLGGYTYQTFNYDESRASALGFLSDALGANALQVGAGGAKSLQPFSKSSKSVLISYLARVNYDLAGKYLATFNFRADGSSRFAEPWGFFPSGSLGWRISQEKFMSGVEAINDLKLRVGYGVTGNQDLPPYNDRPSYAGDRFNAGVIGNIPIPGVSIGTFGNNKLRWEKTGQLNVGVDYGLFSNRVSGSLEFYNKVTEDLLFRAPIGYSPLPANESFYFINAGRVRNQGIEFLITTINYEKNNFRWSTDFNFARNVNKVLSLPPGSQQIFYGPSRGQGLNGTNTQVVLVGEPLGTFYGPTYMGVDEKGNEILSPVGGINLDGKPNILGSAQPKWTAGFTNTLSYKGFDLNIFFRGVFGNKIFNNTAAEFSRQSNITNGTNLLKSAVGSPESRDASIVYSSRFIEDGTFVRLQNATLGYNFDVAKLAKAKIGSLRVYVTGQNLLTFTNYSGFNPEVNAVTAVAADGATPSVGLDYGGYPPSRTLIFGLSLGF